MLDKVQQRKHNFTFLLAVRGQELLADTVHIECFTLLVKTRYPLVQLVWHLERKLHKVIVTKGTKKAT